MDILKDKKGETMATITFEVGKTGTVEYEMGDEDYEVLINEYNGDVKKFIRELDIDIDDSYVDYYEYDINDINYKDEDIKAGITEYSNKKGLVYDDNYDIDKLASYKPLLKNYLTEEYDSIISLNIDKDLALQVYKFADVDNPKIELDYVRVYGDKMIATDTRMLIIANHKVLYSTEILIPSCFLWTLDKGGELFMDENQKACLKYNGLFYSTKDKRLYKYPDVDRILPKEFNWETINKCEPIDFYGYEAIKLEEGAIIDKKYWDMIEPFGFTKYSQLGANLSIYFEKDGIEIMVMPVLE